MHIESITSALRQSVSSLHKMLRRQTAEVAAYSMTELETIGLLARNNSMLPTELATRTRITTQSMSQILKKMEEQGIIERTPSEEDKRKVYISLTKEGKKLVAHVQYSKDIYLEELIERILTTKEKEILAKAIPVLTKLATTL